MSGQSCIPSTIRFTRFLLFIALLWGTPHCGFTQINSSKGIPTITNYSPKDYKASNQIWSIGQDPNGFMYFGSNSGIIRYDGVSWQKIITPNDQIGVNTRALTYDPDLGMLYGSFGDFGRIIKDSLGNFVQESFAHLVPEEHRGFNDIWTINRAKDKIYFQARTIIFIYDLKESDPSKKISAWIPQNLSMFAFAFEDDYYVHELEVGLLKNFELIPGSEFLGEERVQSLTPYDQPGQFLIGMFSKGIYLYNGAEFTQVKTPYDSQYETYNLYKSIPLKEGRVAISAVGDGIKILNLRGEIEMELNFTHNLVDNNVYSFFEDNLGNLWTGTENGISKIEISSPLTRYTYNNAPIGNIIVLNEFNEDLYIGTAFELLVLDNVTGEIRSVPGVANGQIFGLKSDGEQLLIVGNGLNGVADRSGYQIIGNQEGAMSISSILLSKSYPGYGFLGSPFGLLVMEKNPAIKIGAGSWRLVGKFKEIERDIYSIEEDSKGIIYAGTQAGEIFKIEVPKVEPGQSLDFEAAKITLINQNYDPQLKGLLGSVYHANNKVYLSTSSGFFYFDPETGKIIKDSVLTNTSNFKLRDLSDVVMIEDQLGRLLYVMGSGKKIATPDGKGSYTISAYPANLFTGEIISSAYAEKNGTLWVGTEEGLIRIEESSGYNTTNSFKSYISSIQSGENILEVNIFTDQIRQPELSFRSNSVLFNFGAPFFVQEKQTEYQTYLEGFDEDWSAWGKNTFKEFTNLPHGTFTFHVRARNIYGTISEEAVYTFVVLAPWYATWWAYLLYLLLFGLVFLLIYRFQKRRILQKENHKARERELAHAREIEKAYEALANSHENLKSTQEQLVQQEKLASLGQLTAGIAHEIKNPLNFINNFSELSEDFLGEMEAELKKENPEMDTENLLDLLEDVKANLRKIRHHGHRADNIVKSMLMHSRGEKGEIKETDLNALIREYSNLAFHGMRANPNPINVEIILDLDEELQPIRLNAEDFSRVILNLTKNAFDAMRDKINAGSSEYKAKLEFRTKDLTDNVLLEVKDNGPGVPEEIRDKLLMPFFTTKKGTDGTGLGLSITHDIVKSHGGTLEIESQVNEFTLFRILLPKLII